MKIELDFRLGVPIYVQLVDQIKHLIASGQLNPGDQLPTVRQLAADLRVNFNTIARAYRLLDEAGVISTQHGRGTYILEQSVTENGDVLRKESFIGITKQYLETVNRLGFSQEEIIEAIKRMMAEQYQSREDKVSSEDS
jgi:GntR family transcriptional regulator